jgi:hypothetical protein
VPQFDRCALSKSDCAAWRESISLAVHAATVKAIAAEDEEEVECMDSSDDDDDDDEGGGAGESFLRV